LSCCEEVLNQSCRNPELASNSDEIISKRRNKTQTKSLKIVDEKLTKKEIRNAATLVLGIAVIFVLFNGWQKASAPEQRIEQRIEQEILVIPKIFVSVPIIFSVSAEEKVLQEDLKRGVAHLPQTAKPGEIGNCYIVGHSSDYPWSDGLFKEVFAQLPKLAVGDEILVQKGEAALKYIVLETKIVEANDLSVLSQETSGQKILTLQTSYPIGTADKRFLVIAKIPE